MSEVTKVSKSVSASAIVPLFLVFGLEAINEELVARKMAPVEDPEAGATLLAAGTRSLDEFAATALNLSRGAISAEEMTAAMAKAFPSHRIGDRHGPHYISLARTGSLSEKCRVDVRYVPAKGGRKKSGGAKTFDLSAVEPKQLAALVKSSKGTPLEAIVGAEVARRAALEATEAPSAK